MKYYRTIFLTLFLLALPWQTRWIIDTVLVGGDVSQYGQASLYVFDLFLLLYLVSSRSVWTKQRLQELWNKTAYRWAIVGLAGGLAWALVSVLWSFEGASALSGALHLLLAGLFAMTLWLDTDTRPDVVLGSLAAGLLVPSLIGWLQVWQQVIPASSVLGIAAQDPSVLGTAVVETGGMRWLRAYGTFPHPNIMGGFAAIGLAASLVVAARRVLRHEVLFWATAAATAGVLVMSVSRGAWLAAALGVGVLFWGYRRVSDEPLLRSMKSTLLMACMVLVVATLTLAPVVQTRIAGEGRIEEQSLSVRQSQWSEAGDVLARGVLPVLGGVGMSNYTFALEHIRPFGDVWEYQPVHNVPTLLLIELGLIGALLLLGCIIASDWMVHARWRTSASVSAMALGATVLVLSLVDHYLWTQASGIYLLALFLALNVKFGEEAHKQR